MADKKINELAAATLPLTDTHLFPVANPSSGLAKYVAWADMKAQVIGGSGILVYYVDGNNSSIGDGSITNPFKSIEQAYNKSKGTGTAENPQFQNVGIIVAACQYFTSINIWLNNVAWYFESGAKVSYIGVDYFIDTYFASASVQGQFYVHGDLEFTTSSGGFIRNTGVATTTLDNKFMSIECLTASGAMALGSGPDTRPFVYIERQSPYTSWSPPTLFLYVRRAMYSKNQTTIYQKSGFFIYNGLNTSSLSYGMSIDGSVGGAAGGAIYKHVNPDTGTRKGIDKFDIRNAEIFGLNCTYLFDIDGNTSEGRIENINMGEPGTGLTHSNKLMIIRSVTKQATAINFQTKFFLKNFHMPTGSFVDTEIITLATTGVDFDYFDMINCTIPYPYTISRWIKLGRQSYENSPIANFNVINGNLNLTNIPTYSSNALAIAGGLVANDLYRETSTNNIKIVS